MTKHFIRPSLLSLILLAGCTATRVAPPATQPIADAVAPSAPFPRSANISPGWQFIRQDVDGAQAVAFEDKRWTTVDLPHTWNVDDGSDGGNDYYRGPGWYRKHLAVTPAQAGKQLFLRFGAASLVADIYVNGQLVGQHRGGFAAFCFDVTGKLHQGDNAIAVRVSNAKTDDVAPLGGDFTVFGGLYRDVELLSLDPLHISPVDDASPGVYVKQSDVSAESATLEIITKLQNAGPATDATVSVDIIDSDGKSVAYAATASKISANIATDSEVQITMPRPHLWNGLADPYQYTVLASVNYGGRMVDVVSVPLGIRTVGIDGHGFLLNGKPYPLHGVNLHQEAPGRGWAARPADQEQAYGFIKELGATVVRMAHYQHFDYEYTLCDRLGVVAWAEVPLVNRIGTDPNFAAITKQQLRELIKQQYNHPSIAFWSLYNEVANKPNDQHWQLLHDLNDLAHQLDPTRLTTGASNQDANLPLSRWTDVTAFNRYTGWYGGQVNGWSNTVAKLVRDVNGPPKATTTQPGSQPTSEPADNLTPDEIAERTAAATAAATEPATLPTTTLPAPRSIGISEYGAGASIRQHEVDPGRPKANNSSWHPEEYQAILHEQAYRAMAARPDVWGTFVWALFDFSSDGRREGEHPGRNDKGLVTFDRTVRKDAFYFYKANWSHEPFVYLAGKRYQPHPTGPADVKVYSNCEAVELTVNGRSQGTLKSDNGQSDAGTFIWPAVVFSGRKLDVTVTGTKAGRTFSDKMTWTIDPTATTHPAPTTKPTTRSATTRRSTTRPTTMP